MHAIIKAMLSSAAVASLSALAANCGSASGDEAEASGSEASTAGMAKIDEGQAAFIRSAHLDKQAEWFRTTPFSSAGIPMLLFRLFPEFAKDLWGNTVEELPSLGLPRNETDGKTHALALGLGYHRSSKALIPGTEHTPLDVTSFQVVGLTCGACHISRIRVPAAGAKSNEGDIKFLLGNGNNQFDPNAFGEAVWKTVQRPDFTGARFRELVRKQEEWQLTHRTSWEFNSTDPVMRAQQLLEVGLFLNTVTKIKDPESGEFGYLSDIMVNKIKRRVLERQGTIDKDLEPLYGDHKDRLHGGTPGQADALGKIASVAGAQASTGAIVDLPAVWRQDTREYAQYDGSIRDPFFRNLGATMGVSGAISTESNRTKGCVGPIPDCTDQRDVNTANAYFLAPFVTKLPAPKYPFGIDDGRAARGEKLFETHCASCHAMPKGSSRTIVAKTVRVPFTIDVGADEQRGRQLDLEAIVKIGSALKRACRDGVRHQDGVDVPDSACNVDPKDILFDQTRTPGYVGQPLNGIWATAPYLHNGSVPNLRALLVPKLRPATFWRGNISYDTKNLGWVDAKESGVSTSARYDTTMLSNKNTGHSAKVMLGNLDWGSENNAAALEDLLEYMKTL
ncbi:MAG: hypothetical protein NVS3B20_17860 [Polyangiales bacterium]